MSYDVGGYAKLGLLYKLLHVDDPQHPTTADIEAVRHDLICHSGCAPRRDRPQKPASVRGCEADTETIVGERTADLTHNLMEYHLSLVRELEAYVDSDCMATLLERFSIKQGLRASHLTAHAGLHKVLLPIAPW
jgi:hypothetical protein